LKKPIEEIIHSKSFQKRPYFNVEFIKKAFATHCKDKKNISQTIWRWVNLELWLRKFIEWIFEVRDPSLALRVTLRVSLPQSLPLLRNDNLAPSPPSSPLGDAGATNKEHRFSMPAEMWGRPGRKLIRCGGTLKFHTTKYAWWIRQLHLFFW